MNAHLLLQQLLEEYGLSGHNSAHIDDSVSEYVMEAMAGDSLESEEKLEFVGDIILGLSSLDEGVRLLFVQDLILASKQLLTGEKEKEATDFPPLGATTDTTTDTTTDSSNSSATTTFQI